VFDRSRMPLADAGPGRVPPAALSSVGLTIAADCEVSRLTSRLTSRPMPVGCSLLRCCSTCFDLLRWLPRSVEWRGYASGRSPPMAQTAHVRRRPSRVARMMEERRRREARAEVVGPCAQSQPVRFGAVSHERHVVVSHHNPTLTRCHSCARAVPRPPRGGRGAAPHPPSPGSTPWPRARRRAGSVGCTSARTAAVGTSRRSRRGARSPRERGTPWRMSSCTNRADSARVHDRHQ